MVISPVRLFLNFPLLPRINTTLFRYLVRIKRQSLHYENRRNAVRRSSSTGEDNGPKKRKILAFGAKTEAEEEEEDRTGVTGLSSLSGVHTLVWTHIAAFAHSRKVFGETSIQRTALLDF